jgi:hypothetical protein
MHDLLLTPEWHMRMQVMENWPECHCLRLETLRSPVYHCQSLQPQGFIEYCFINLLKKLKWRGLNLSD